MSAQDCIDAIRAATGRDISDDEITELLDLMLERQRRHQRKGKTAGEALQQSAEEIAEELRRAALIEKRNELLNRQAQADLVTYINDNWSDRPDIGLESFLVGTNVARTGSRDSVAAAQKQLSSTYIAGLLDDLDRSGHLPMLTSGAIDREVAQALWRLNQDKPDLTGLPEAAVDIAKIARKWQDKARIDANRAGANIGRLDNYVVRQSHDPYKLHAEGFDEWVKFIASRLDADTIPPGVNAKEWLFHTFDNLVSGKHLKLTPDGEVQAAKGPANLAAKLSAERVLHFKDADSWFDYNQRFGTGSVREALIGGLDRMGEATGIMRKLGTNPRHVWDKALDQLELGLIGQTNARKRLKTKRAVMLDNRFKEIDGTTRIAVNHETARVSANLRAIQNMSKLGGAVVSALADLPVAASELRYQGRGFLSSLGKLLTDLVRGHPPREKKQILSSLGVFFDSMRGDVISRFSADDTLGGRMTRAQRIFFKLNGLTWWTETVRSSAALMMSHHLAQNVRVPWRNLGDLQRVLSMYGFDEVGWNVIRKSPAVLADGRPYITPDSIRATGANNAEELANKLRTYITDRASYAVLEPDARTRSILRQGSQPGTPSGELWRFATQFKAFPTSIIQKSIGRELFGRGYTPSEFGARGTAMRELGKALVSGNGEILGVAQLMVWTTAFGYLAMSAKDLLKGRTPRDPEEKSTWMAAMLQGGALGIYGDFIVGDMNRFGGGIIQTAAGPVASSVEDVLQVFQRIRDGDDAAASAFAFAKNNAPFLNLFYARAALDYLFFYQIQEAMNPGYTRRLERRVERENKQEFLISPRDAVGVN